MSDRLITVIVPAFNAARYLRRCVESILRQTHAELEVIVVNDGSTDGTGALIDEFAAHDARVKAVHLPFNVGIHAARSAGLRAARGAFIGFVDADDWIEREMYAELFRHAQASDADIAICGAIVAFAENRPGPAKVRFRRARILDDNLLGRFCRLEFGSGVLWNKLYRAEIIRPAAALTLQRHVGEDYIVNVGCFAAAARVVTVPASPYRYACRSDSASRSGNGARRFSELLQAYVACLEAYAHALPQHLPEIDVLYARQMRLECYAISAAAQLQSRESSLRESLQRLAIVHPAGIYALVRAFDTAPATRERTCRTAIRQFLASGQALFHALQRSVSRDSLNVNANPSKP